MKLHPWNDVVKQGVEYIEQGFKLHQQFNCARCGAKQTMDTPNVFFEHGICEKCGHETDIKKDGHNYMLTIGV